MDLTQIGHKSDEETRREWILEYLSKNTKIKAKDVEKQFNIHRDTAIEDLKSIKNIIKKGAGNNVWYELK